MNKEKRFELIKRQQKQEFVRRLKLKQQLTKLKKEEPTYSPEPNTASSGANKKTRKNRPNTFKKQIDKVQALEQEKAAIRQQQEENRLASEKKQQARQSRTRKLTQKTHKGQPIMANMINDLLEQIQK